MPTRSRAVSEASMFLRIRLQRSSRLCVQVGRHQWHDRKREITIEVSTKYGKQSIMHWLSYVVLFCLRLSSLLTTPFILLSLKYMLILRLWPFKNPYTHAPSQLHPRRQATYFLSLSPYLMTSSWSRQWPWLHPLYDDKSKSCHHYLLCFCVPKTLSVLQRTQ